MVLLAASSLPADSASYLRDVKPLLKARCYACHGALKQESKLRVDTVESLRRGGDSGPAIVARDAAASRLMERIQSSDADVRMPPEGKPLTPEEIAKIKDWIAAGAAAPATEEPEPDPRAHWAFQPPLKAAIPTITSDTPSQNPVDAFVLDRLQREHLSPRPLARREILLRRLYLDLIGMPPTVDELQAFLADDSPQAWDQVVNRLLDDPRYGERWARHWMDIWRYSDWYGRRQEKDVRNSAAQIWRWRDWIVRSLNADHGYDRMLREMLAADEICPEDDDAVVATGYIIRNFYSLNANDWMRNVVEHTGKAFLGLTFNCAHCHDHKYDPITQENYFQLRAIFEPVYVRQDRLPGEADPGKFQDYDYGGSRAVQRLGLVRIFDKAPDAPTWLYTGGDERNRVKERGSISPGVPAFLTGGSLDIQPVSIPPRGRYPGLRAGIQQTVLAEARTAVDRAEQDMRAAEAAGTEPSPDSLAAVREMESAFDAALKQSRAANEPGALSGRQSLVLEAPTGRRVVQNGLRHLKELPDGSMLEFQLQLQTDAHINFQFAKDVVKGLTAGYVAWDRGKIVSYQPGSFTEFPVGRYDYAGGQRQFHALLKLETKADRCLLTIRCVSDGSLLCDQVPIALNGWNPVGDAMQGISFDARTGSIALIDEVVLSSPRLAADEVGAPPHRLAAFDFESPVYTNGRDVQGIQGWSISPFGAAPATSVVSDAGANAELRVLSRRLEAARRIAQLPALRRQATTARLTAAQAELAGVQARIAADVARYSASPPADRPQLIQQASVAERTAAVKAAEAAVLTEELAAMQAEAKPLDDPNRAKELDAAAQKLSAAKQRLDQAVAALSDAGLADQYTAFSPTYPETSTGRRRAFAEWLTHKRHPLTARVAVNHIWSRHFHAPLVASVFDFGRNGAAPTHPELLDWLAVDFMDHGWSMKHLHRRLVSSDAYRRVSSTGDAARNVELDPENKLLWRMNAGRMEAEAVRDSLLYCAGKLDLSLGGQELENSESLTTFRRSLYYAVHPEGGGKGPLGELFDAPDPLECYRRTRSIVPQQALALTNSDLIHQLSTTLVAEWKPAATDEFIAAMFRKILSRSPTEEELKICRESLGTGPAEEQSKALESLVRTLFNHNDFVTIR